MKQYRTGAHWEYTIVEWDDSETPDIQGRRPSDRLIGMGLTPEDAEFIVTALNLATPDGDN